MKNAIKEFLKLESSGGIILIGGMVLALIMANSPLAALYDWILHLPVGVKLGSINLDSTLHHWVNDGLMAIFFLTVGLEVKREVLEGELSNISQVMLPGVAALGGMVVPALIYFFFNQGDDFAMKGWAIPTATDIAFALGILSLLGKRVPVSLKLFLMTLAIVDDLGAILIIAIFYSADLSMISLILAAVFTIILIVMNLRGVVRQAAFMIIGVLLWLSVLYSGIHATLAGVVIAFTIPLRAKNEFGESPLHHLEHTLHPWVTYMILPLFAFANAGISFAGMSISSLFEPVPLGIMSGLFVGKLIGVFGFSFIAIKLRFAELPDNTKFAGLFGASILAGIGFTMSLFIDGLAFAGNAELYGSADRLAIIVASTFAAVAGYLFLKSTKISVKEITE
ncbi:MAG: Na+/H+ antiporter NhaA [Chlorobi bacterium]|nr:Na+/H+ antiporter NhaA [Chlorobiota bacterium]